MRKLILALLLLPYAAEAATSVTLSWTAPTANTDGSTPALVSGYNLYQDTSDAALSAQKPTAQGGKPAVNGTVLNSPAMLTYTLANVLPGTYYYALTAWYCTNVATGTGCVESVQSAHVSTTVAATPKVPGTPANIKISVTAAP